MWKYKQRRGVCGRDMILRLRCLYLYYSPEHKTLTCGPRGQDCRNKGCPFSEVNNYDHLCGNCRKRKTMECPNHGKCSILKERPYFEKKEY